MNKIKITPKILEYQRNGSSGIGFYLLVFDWADSYGERGKNFIATFETTEFHKEDNPRQVLVESTRVVDPAHPKMAWRGDNFGDAIDEKLNQMTISHGLDSFYGLIEIINRTRRRHLP